MQKCGPPQISQAAEGRPGLPWELLDTSLFGVGPPFLYMRPVPLFSLLLDWYLVAENNTSHTQDSCSPFSPFPKPDFKSTLPRKGRKWGPYSVAVQEWTSVGSCWGGLDLQPQCLFSDS